MNGESRPVGRPAHQHPDSTPSLFDAPETAGRARASDPAPSHEAARHVNVGGQRQEILVALAREVVVTADRLEEVHPRVHRSSWSSRLAGMRRDGLVTHAAPVVKVAGGRRRTVTSFRLTPAGRELLEGVRR